MTRLIRIAALISEIHQTSCTSTLPCSFRGCDAGETVGLFGVTGTRSVSLRRQLDGRLKFPGVLLRDAHDARAQLEGEPRAEGDRRAVRAHRYLVAVAEPARVG